MSVWCLEAYCTDSREARSREYTTSRVEAELWERIPRIQFTDNGHGIVFQATPHKGKRKRVIARTEHAREHMQRLRAERRRA